MNESEADADVTENTGKAYHEAGHAVLQHYFGQDLQSVSILPQGGNAGGVAQARGQHPVILQQQGVLYENTPQRDAYLCHLAMASLAGEVAQKKFCPESVQPHHAIYDQRRVNYLVKSRGRYISPPDPEDQIDELHRAQQIFRPEALPFAPVASGSGTTAPQDREDKPPIGGTVVDAMWSKPHARLPARFLAEREFVQSF